MVFQFLGTEPYKVVERTAVEFGSLLHGEFHRHLSAFGAVAKLHFLEGATSAKSVCRCVQSIRLEDLPSLEAVRSNDLRLAIAVVASRMDGGQLNGVGMRLPRS